jgi:hypothetical protein
VLDADPSARLASDPAPERRTSQARR